MTQDDYKLWTGSTASYTDAEWQKIQTAATKRLARFLCLETLPEPLPDDLAEMTAYFISAVITNRSASGEVQRKSVRNFTVEFSKPTAADAFAAIYQQFADVIEAYSDCGDTIHVERTKRHCCNGRL